jgi:hypothetical protein
MTLDILIRGAAGNFEAARAMTRAFEAEMDGRPISGVCHAVCALGCNDSELAMRHFEAAISNHDPLVGYVAVDPAFAGLRSRADWPKLVAAINLATS